MKNGFFITQAQMKYSQYLALKKKTNILDQITKADNFEKLRNQLVQDKEFKRKLTLCIDLENVFLARIDLNDD